MFASRCEIRVFANITVFIAHDQPNFRWEGLRKVNFELVVETTFCTDNMSSGSGELVLKPGAGALIASSEQRSVKKRPPKKPLEEEEFTEVP